ncbi:MAG: DoxX family protein [Candidatus Yonathbacteria bacterium]|nr:DoxX family protein [Candidatus Yonathbacteria bacterium]
MLNPFPDLLAFSLLAPFFLRIVLGISYARFGYLKLIKSGLIKISFLKKDYLKPEILFVLVVGFLEAIGGILLVIGLFTQITSLFLSIIMLGVIVIKLRSGVAFSNELGYHILLFVATFSLLFSGAGAFAIDLPL